MKSIDQPDVREDPPDGKGRTEQEPFTSLVEGEDYYDEDGRIVFTAAYHLRRGYCCDSGCRHCPYGGPSPIQKPDR